MYIYIYSFRDFKVAAAALSSAQELHAHGRGGSGDALAPGDARLHPVGRCCFFSRRQKQLRNIGDSEIIINGDFLGDLSSSWIFSRVYGFRTVMHSIQWGFWTVCNHQQEVIVNLWKAAIGDDNSLWFFLLYAVQTINRRQSLKMNYCSLPTGGLSWLLYKLLQGDKNNIL